MSKETEKSVSTMITLKGSEKEEFIELAKSEGLSLSAFLRLSAYEHKMRKLKEEKETEEKAEQ